MDNHCAMGTINEKGKCLFFPSLLGGVGFLTISLIYFSLGSRVVRGWVVGLVLSAYQAPSGWIFSSSLAGYLILHALVAAANTHSRPAIETAAAAAAHINVYI